jgi:ABC-type transport system involved in multi-copper enzyme maturation permease subunit
MTFLPIVDRELRVAARSRFTFWSRLAAAAFALLIFAALQLIAQKSGGAVAAGQLEFTILKWMAFIYACAMGLFLTADSLSEEKREGTLGLLFLTDLRGYDVVFGKLLTQSLRAFYGLLAAFPIMGLALLAGGVTGGEFSRSILVICDTLFFSLSLGMLVSSLSRDSTKAMNGTLLLLLLILGGLPFADYAFGGFDPVNFHPILTLASPAYLFSHTDAYRFNEYWICLLLQNALAWSFLALASLRVPHSWQDVSTTTTRSRPTFFGRWRYGSPRARLALRLRLLARDPVIWLTLRDRWLSRLVLGLTLIVLLARTWGLVTNFNEIRPSAVATPRAASQASNSNSNKSGATVVYSSTNSSSSTVVTYSTGVSPTSQALVQFTAVLEWLLGFALCLWVASQASRFFVEAVRNGALELLLVTPVNPPQIVRAQWAALWRTFAFPVLCVVLLQLAGVVVNVLQMKHQMVFSSSMAGRAAGSPPYVPPDMTWFYVTNAVTGIITSIAGLVAIAWFGMWMGLTNRKTSLAVLKTICFVVVLPWIAFMFARVFLMFVLIPLGITRNPNPTLFLSLPVLIVAILTLGKDGFFIWWSYHNLRVNFRKQITGDRNSRFRVARPLTPPPLPPPAMLPPVIPPGVGVSPS